MEAARALLLKEEGNRHFGDGDYIGAEALYSKAYVLLLPLLLELHEFSLLAAISAFQPVPPWSLRSPTFRRAQGSLQSRRD